MTIVAAQNRDSYFAMVPERYVFSDHLTDRGLHILAFLDASKSNHKGFVKGDPMRWPVFSTKELAARLRMSERTLKREIARLQKSGHIKTTKTVKGNRYELVKVEFEDDTYRGREVSNKKHAQVSEALLVSGVSSGALRLWMILDRIKGKNPSAYASHALLAKLMGVSDRTIRTWLKDLRDLAVVTSELREKGGMCEYFLSDVPSPVAEEYEEEPPSLNLSRGDYISVCLELLDLWVIGVTGEDWRDNEDDDDNDDGGEIDQVLAVIEAALKATRSPALVRARIENGLEQYGFGYPLDFINKVLGDYLPEDEFDELLDTIDGKNDQVQRGI